MEIDEKSSGCDVLTGENCGDLHTSQRLQGSPGHTSTLFDCDQGGWRRKICGTAEKVWQRGQLFAVIQTNADMES